jgi:hypothetical protein
VTWFTGWSSLRVNLPVSELSRLWFFMKNKLITKPFESKKKITWTLTLLCFITIITINFTLFMSMHIQGTRSRYLKTRSSMEGRSKPGVCVYILKICIWATRAHTDMVL